MSSPPDEATQGRLRRAFKKAAAELGYPPEASEAAEVWGWEGHGLSGPVGDRWLRLVAKSATNRPSEAWRGPETAQAEIPELVPRPRFHVGVEWEEGVYRYRAELYDRIRGSSLSHSAMPPPYLRLPDAWWASLDIALGAIASTSTDRWTVRQERLDRVLPGLLNAPPSFSTEVPAWTTAHGDLQWSNLAGPRLLILDWERWGRAPVGYDEASLYIPSLIVPEVAERVWRTFVPVLSSPAGQFAQLVVASEFLQGMQRGNNLELEPILRRHVASLLKQPDPGSPPCNRRQGK